MPVPLEEYTVRKNGLVSYDTLPSVAKKYGTTAQALKYFNKDKNEVQKLNTGEGLLTLATKIDPAKVPKLNVPKSPTGNSSTNKTPGSVSSTSYTSLVSKRIILKRINASYGTALKNNIPFLAEDKDVGKYINSTEVQMYSGWEPLYNMFKSFDEREKEYYARIAALNASTSLTLTEKKALADSYLEEYQRAINNIFEQNHDYYAKTLRVEETEAGRITRFNINDTNNPTQTPPDTESDKKAVLAIIEKIVYLCVPTDSYGHWWLEIYQGDIDLPNIAGKKNASSYETVAPKNLKASYGFWPLKGAGLGSGAIIGKVPGGVNNCRGPGATNLFDITNPDDQFDPYAGNETISWKVDDAYFVTDPYGRSEDEIYNDIIAYLTYYPKDRYWAWPDSDEDQEHCQTFQKELLAACGLVAAPKIEKDQYPPLDKYKIFWGEESLTAADKPSIYTYSP